MKSFTVAALAGAAAASPFSFPLQNGFPNPSAEAIALIQKQAGGSLPNGPLPTSVSPDVITSLQLIAANEIFETAYFTELYKNVSTSVPGYQVPDKKFAEDALFAIRAQEELHALGANTILKNVGAPTVGACKYQFPVADFTSAIKLANTFTDIVLGVLPAVQYTSATDGGAQGASIIPLIGSIIGQEAEQVGWFRTLQNKKPSAAPFLSPNTPEFTLSAIKMFIVPGSCPSEYTAIEKKVKSFPPLMVTSPPTLQNQQACYEVAGPINAATNKVAYISGQNLPVVVDIQNVATKDGKTTFTASFPYSAKNFADGLTTAAVVKQAENFVNGSQVAQATLFGPGLIEFQ